MKPPQGMRFTNVTTDDDLAANLTRWRIEQESIVHVIVEGSGLTACCERTPFELPMLDRLTTDSSLRTCRAWAGVEG